MIQPYRWLAHYYDEIFSAYRLPLDRARERILERILPHIENACDLACGTGTTALELARKGIRMYGVDLSPYMCRLTRENARRAGLTVRVLRGDMRSFRLPQKVDLITCEFDALNHVPTRADLGKVVRSVKRALRPGGYFFFDVNNSLGFKRYWTGTVWIEKPQVVLVMRNGHNRQASRAWADVEWFVREGTCWQRKHERVEEVCWTSDEIRHIFREAGFDWVRAWDAAPFFKDNPVVRRGCRTIYLVRNARS
jgi:SAM-dependent methyltransferase